MLGAGGLGVDWMANCFLDERDVLEVENSHVSSTMFQYSLQQSRSFVAQRWINCYNTSVSESKSKPRTPADASVYSS